VNATANTPDTTNHVAVKAISSTARILRSIVIGSNVI
jgi:hypothetical protein